MRTLPNVIGEKIYSDFKSIQPSEICSYLKEHPNTVLLDVRTKEEFEGKSNPNFGTLRKLSIYLFRN